MGWDADMISDHAAAEVGHPRALVLLQVMLWALDQEDATFNYGIWNGVPSNKRDFELAERYMVSVYKSLAYV